MSLWEQLAEHTAFLLVWLGVFAGLFAIAWLAGHWTKADLRRPGGARYTAFVAMSAALGGVLMSLEIPLFFAPSFYQLDFGELPVLICSFYLGPAAGVAAELLKVLIKLLIKGTSTAFVGDFANFFIGCSFILPASIVYHVRKSRKTALLGMAAGTAMMTVVGSLFNAFYLIPTFSSLFGMPLDAIVAMGAAVNPGITSVSTLVLMAVVPFNLLKGVVVSAITFVLYKRVEQVLARLLHPRQSCQPSKI
ncbi:MAG: ECF transporter S component [Oscillospiraceae bacterium]|nr:ECF transporter S component [Oscillospiraceae bacterium]